MGSGTLHRARVPLYPEADIPVEINQSLEDALHRAQSIHEVVHGDAVRNNEDVTPWAAGRRLYEAGGWTARYHSDQGGAYSEVNALRLMTDAAHFGNVKQRIASGGGVIPPHKLAPLVRYACAYNDRIRTFGYDEPSARIDHVVDAMAEMRRIVTGERARGSFANAVDGMRYQMWGERIIAFAGRVRDTTLVEDLEGIDVVLRISKHEGIPFDVTACAAAVMRKCNLKKPATEAVRNGVMVVSVGVRKAQMGDTFEIDEDVARKIYNKRMADVIKRARHDPNVRKVTWRER